MKGDHITPNDTIIVRLTNRIAEGEIALVELQGKRLIKRISYTDDGILLKSSNPHYKPMLIPYGEVLAVGVVDHCIKAVE